MSPSASVPTALNATAVPAKTLPAGLRDAVTVGRAVALGDDHVSVA